MSKIISKNLIIIDLETYNNYNNFIVYYHTCTIDRNCNFDYIFRDIINGRINKMIMFNINQNEKVEEIERVKYFDKNDSLYGLFEDNCNNCDIQCINFERGSKMKIDIRDPLFSFIDIFKIIHKFKRIAFLRVKNFSLGINDDFSKINKKLFNILGKPVEKITFKECCVPKNNYGNIKIKLKNLEGKDIRNFFKDVLNGNIKSNNIENTKIYKSDITINVFGEKYNFIPKDNFYDCKLDILKHKINKKLDFMEKYDSDINENLKKIVKICKKLRLDYRSKTEGGNFCVDNCHQINLITVVKNVKYHNISFLNIDNVKVKFKNSFVRYFDPKIVFKKIIFENCGKDMIESFIEHVKFYSFNFDCDIKIINCGLHISDFYASISNKIFDENYLEDFLNSSDTDVKIKLLEKNINLIRLEIGKNIINQELIYNVFKDTTSEDIFDDLSIF